MKSVKSLPSSVLNPKGILLAFVTAALLVLPGCVLLHMHKTNDLAGTLGPGDQPDKILFQKAQGEIEHSRYDVGRLTLQTLINTYPDSEYLSKAKLAIADSYFKEGGVSGLTQAEAEYKDFITFFPTAPEAPEAQFRIGMAHFHLMAKPDRDRQEARLAEAEFKDFLLKYPDSPIMPRVKRRLREAQEVLAQSDYRIAQFYYMKGANPAAKGRFQEIADKYPNFSQADDALWYLGQTLERMKKSHDAVPYYKELVAYYPLGDHVDDAKDRLKALHQPIPHPSKATLARARADAIRKKRPDMVARAMGIMAGSPDTTATRRGPVMLGHANPPTVEAGNKTAAPAGASIAVSTANESSLSSGVPVEPKPTADNPSGNAAAPSGNATSATGQPNQSTAGSSSTNSSSSGDSQTEPEPKKKGKFGVFKKLNPF
jgi:outer membrane protein assembly factor BamD